MKFRSHDQIICCPWYLFWKISDIFGESESIASVESITDVNNQQWEDF